MSEKSRFNPTLYVMIGIPTAAVIASFFTFYLALRDAEPQLPAQYVSEGQAIEADFARAAIAREAGLRVELSAEFDRVEAVLSFGDTTTPAARAERLLLRLTHVTQPALDRLLTLDRVGETTYRATVSDLSEGPWLVQLEDPDSWRLRSRWSSTTFSLTLGFES